MWSRTTASVYPKILLCAAYEFSEIFVLYRQANSISSPVLAGGTFLHFSNKPFKVQWCQIVTLKSVQCHPGLTYIVNF